MSNPHYPGRAFRAVAKADVLYHLTGLDAALAIITHDCFKLNPSSEVEASIHGRQDAFYASFARSKTSDFVRDFATSAVVFTLNGQRLGHTMKTVPVDYWSNSDRRSYAEHEERLLSVKPTLQKFHTFVTEVAIISPALAARSGLPAATVAHYRTTITALLTQAHKLGYPTPTLYASYQDYLKRKAVAAVPGKVSASDIKRKVHSATRQENDDLLPEERADSEQELADLRAYLSGGQGGHTTKPRNGARLVVGAVEHNSLFDNETALKLIVKAMRGYRVRTVAALVKLLDEKWASTAMTATAKSDVLYHCTPLTNAAKIIGSDTLNLKASNDIESQKHGRADVYWASFARSKTSSYLANAADSGCVVFQLNGRHLGQKMKTAPTNYWDNDSLRGHEQEERLLGPKPTLPNFHSYVSGVIVIADPDNLAGATGDVKRRALAALLANLQRKGYPEPQFFKSYKAWLNRKPLAADAVTAVLAGAGEFNTSTDDPDASDYQKKFNKQLETYLFGWQRKTDTDFPTLPYDIDKSVVDYAMNNVNGHGSPAAQALVVNALREFKVRDIKQLVDRVELAWQANKYDAEMNRRVKSAEERAEQVLTGGDHLHTLLGEDGKGQFMDYLRADVLSNQLDSAIAYAKKAGKPLPKHLAQIDKDAGGDTNTYLRSVWDEHKDNAHKADAAATMNKTYKAIAADYGELIAMFSDDDTMDEDRLNDIVDSIGATVQALIESENTHVADAFRRVSIGLLPKTGPSWAAWRRAWLFHNTPAANLVDLHDKVHQ